jgi:xylulokinase
LAGVGAGIWKTVDEACDAVVHVTQRITPDADRATQMEKGYQTYRRIYPALKQIYAV